MLKRVNAYINKNHLLMKTDKVVVAVSTGSDSMALLHILRTLGYSIIIAHVNHKQRDQSEVEESYIKDYAKLNQIPCEIYHLENETGGNFHDSAHKKRYDFFKDVLKKYQANAIATAHHADDNAETIYLNIMRGSNLFGYGGISPIIVYPEYKIVRPLLEESKDAILQYVEQENIFFFEDESNASDVYKRNRFRHHILPLLKQENPHFLQKMNAFSRQMKSVFNFLRKESIKYLELNKNILDVSSFSALDQALRYDILCLLLERFEISHTESILEDMDQIACRKNNQSQMNLKKDYLFVRRYQNVFITQNKEITHTYLEMNRDDTVIFQQKYRFYFTKKIVNNNAKYVALCYNKLVFPIIVRNYELNDKIIMTYGSKKINRLFIDHKVPRELRNEVPLVVSNQEILWVYNYAKSAKVLEMKNSDDIYLVCEEIK